MLPNRSFLDQNDAVFVVGLINHMHPFPSSSLDNPFFEAECTIGLIEDHLFVCPSEEEISIHCDGSRLRTHRVECPYFSSTVVCESWSGDESVVCQLQSANESVTVCL